MFFYNEDKTECIINCTCGCDETVHFALDPFFDDPQYDDCIWEIYSSGSYWRECSFKEKIKKLWKILIGKDYYYHEICMKDKDVEELISYLRTTLDKKYALREENDQIR